MRLIDADKLKQDLLDKSFYPAIVATAIKNAPTVNQYEWISVEDRLPSLGEEVIVAICDESGDTRWKYTTAGWMVTETIWIVDNERRYDVTYWMPFPEYPKGN